MPSEPEKREPVSGQATGEFIPEKADNAGPAEAVTGEYLPEATGARGSAGQTRSPRADQPGAATGEYFPEPGDTRPGEAAGDATGAYIPGQAEESVHFLTGRREAGLTSPASAGAFPTAPPVRTGRYFLKKFHAKGGMGEVWLAEDGDIGRPVALKRMLKGREEHKERFLQEGQVTGQLEHPGVIPVHELGLDENGQPYYVMKFVHGRTLQEVIQAYHKGEGGEAKEVQRLRLLNIFLNLCQTVAYAHSRGVIHRDIKPDNVMVGAYGETLVLDWGLAKVVGKPEDETNPYAHVHLSGSVESMETMAGSVKGTPTYFAPEVAAGRIEEVDQLSDVYLLGGTLYHILTGKPPRHAGKIKELLELARTKPPEPPRTIKPDIPKALEAICLKAIAHEKKNRYVSATALAEDVQRYLAGEPVSAYQENFFERAWRWVKRHKKALGRTAAAVVIGGIALVAFLMVRAAELEAERKLKEEQEQAQRKLEAQQLRAKLEFEAEQERGRIKLEAEKERARRKLEEEKKQRAEEARKRKEAEFKAQELARQDKARIQIKDFRALAEDMRYYAAQADPLTAAAPFFDLAKAEDKGRQALALAQAWGPDLIDMPLEDQRLSLKKELYELAVELAQVKTRQPGAEAAKEILALLNPAARLHAPTKSWYRLRAQALQFLDLEDKGKADNQRAQDAAVPVSALDHYLSAELSRRESFRLSGQESKAKPGEKTLSARDAALTRAMDLYRQALHLDSQHYWSHFQLAACDAGLGKNAEAVKAYGPCVALRPETPWGYSARATVWAELKEYKEALKDLDRALEKDPDFRPTRLSRGIVFWKQKDYDKALADFAAVLAPPENQRLIEAAFQRGQLYLERHEYKNALADFNLIVDHKLEIRTVFLHRARIYLAQGNGEKCLENLSAYLAGKAADPRNPHEQRARELRTLANELPAQARKERETAYVLILDQLDRTLKLGAQSPTLFGELGAVEELLAGFRPKEALQRLREALAAYSKGLDLEPKDVKLRVKRGWVYVTLNQNDKARADFLAAVATDPQHAEAHTGLGYTQASLKGPAEARRHANLALLHGAGDYLVLHNVACIFATLSDKEPAQKEFQDLALDQLYRAVDLWKKGGKTGPDEIRLIQGEPAFSQGLRQRPEFQKLVSDSP